MGFDNYIMLCIHHYQIIQNSFTAPLIPLPSPQILGNHWSFHHLIHSLASPPLLLDFPIPFIHSPLLSSFSSLFHLSSLAKYYHHFLEHTLDSLIHTPCILLRWQNNTLCLAMLTSPWLTTLISPDVNSWLWTSGEHRCGHTSTGYALVHSLGQSRTGFFQTVSSFSSLSIPSQLLMLPPLQ